MIKDLKVGDTTTQTMVVISALARETRGGKPYLDLTFSDGTDTITAKYWDWSSGKKPAVNDIVDIKCQVTEWQGTKQLVVSSMYANTTRHLAEFVPKSSLDISTVYKDAFNLALEIKDETLLSITCGLFEALQQKWLVVPGARTVHHAYVGGTLVHSYSVAKIAKAIAETTGANVDLCVAGGLLHDIGKLFTYNMNGIAIELTDEGQMYDHIFIGAELIGNFAENVVNIDDDAVQKKLMLLRHIILSHHGSLEYGSPVTPCCIEAIIVSAADGIDAATEQVRAVDNPASMWTDRIYTLHNKPHISPSTVKEVMGG